jgi:hypothetical protein
VEEAYLASVKYVLSFIPLLSSKYSARELTARGVHRDEEYVRENDVDVKAAVREVMEQGEERRRKAAEAVAGRQGGDVVMVE